MLEKVVDKNMDAHIACILACLKEKTRGTRKEIVIIYRSFQCYCHAHVKDLETLKWINDDSLTFTLLKFSHLYGY